MMTTCPGQELLSGYVWGLLPEGEFEEIAEHVEKCGSCEAAVLTLEGAPDTVISALRRPVPADPVLAEEACQQAVEQIQALAGDPVVEAPQTSSPLDTATPPASDERLDFLAPAKASDELGRLGSYRVLKQLGAGGMGVVFLAEDIHLKRRVALKVMRPQATAKRGARERFLREAQAAATLEHEHIVTIFQVGEERGMPYLAMQLLKGMSLDDRLRRAEGVRPPALLNIAQILRLGRQIARGLAAAHERGLIHRDIKPANLWLEPEHGGHIKILDFGLARAVEDEAHSTQSGAIVGTPSYMAPEQARSEKVDHRCDLFSLGVVLYRLCTGRLPFRGDSTMAVLTALAMDAPKPVRDLNPAVAPELADLVMQLLNKIPAMRPASAKEVAERLHALERALTEPQSVARPESAKGVTAAPEATPRPSKTPGVPHKRRRVLVAVVGAAALILLAGITTVRIATDKGESVIKADESVEVTIKRNGKPVEDLELKKGRNVTSVYSGDIEVVLKGANADEFVIKNDHITLKRGDKPVVEIERKSPPAAPATAKAVDADRRAAEWVLSISGKLTIRVGDKDQEVAVTKDLPAGEWRVTRILLGANQQISDDGMERLKGLTDLHWLDLNWTRVSDVGLEQVKQLTGLTHLYLADTRVSDAGLAHVRGLTNLRGLILHDTQVSNTGLAHLTGLTRLEALHLTGTRVSDAGLAHFKGLTKLSFLELSSTQVSDAGLRSLTALTKLADLRLNSTQVSDMGLEHLKSLANLRGLNLDGTRVTGTGLGHLKGLTELTELRLGCPTLTDLGIKPVAELTRLEKLSLAGSSVSDEGLKHLHGLDRLKELDLTGTKVTVEGVAALQKALPKCKIAWDGAK
jgi:serine/threonine protein kinase